MFSNPSPSSPAGSRAACACACSWTRRSTCSSWTSPPTTWTSPAGSGSRRPWRPTRGPYFINRFATRIWELEGGVITDYPVPFARYREIKERDKVLAQSQPRPDRSKPKPAPKGGRAQQNARKQLTICERDMEKLESEIKALEADMEASACDYEKYSALYAQKETLDQQLMELMERWEALAEAAEG